MPLIIGHKATLGSGILLLLGMVAFVWLWQSPQSPATPRSPELRVSYRPILCPDCSQPLEPSGLSKIGEHFYIVSDNNHESHLYRLRRQDSVFIAEPSRPFFLPDSDKSDSSPGLDLEGLCYQKISKPLQGPALYMADERQRRIIKRPWSDGPGKASRQGQILNHDMRRYCRRHKLTWSKKLNAGFEGIACSTWNHETANRIFVANERSPVRIYELRYNNSHLHVTNHFQFAGIRDISGLSFYQSHLYILHRSGQKIHKMAWPAGKLVDNYSFARYTKGLYSPGKFPGNAEGLWLDKQYIYIVLDANGQALRSKAIKRIAPERIRESFVHGVWIKLPRQKF